MLFRSADNINGPWEGRVALQDKGVAQGGLIDTPDGRWFAYLFRDNGSVGRIPYLVPVQWEDGWPVLGINGKVPETLDLPASKGLIPGIVASDEFTRKKKDAACRWFGSGIIIRIILSGQLVNGRDICDSKPDG